MEFHSTLNQPEDEFSCLLEINAGAGGTEACDWAEMLLRMYQMWGERKGFKISELNRVDGDVAGIRSAELEISGDFAYGLLKGENGVHRLVRVSPYNSQGKRMTSFLQRFCTSLGGRAHRGGGQSGRFGMGYLPCQRRRRPARQQDRIGRTRPTLAFGHRRGMPAGTLPTPKPGESAPNAQIAFVRIGTAQAMEARGKIEAGKMKNEWGSQIRSYVLDDRRVKDHRTGHQTSQTDAVLDGDLDDFLKAFLMYHGEPVPEDD
jgi:peptide chain release factor 2